MEPNVLESLLRRIEVLESTLTQISLSAATAVSTLMDHQDAIVDISTNVTMIRTDLQFTLEVENANARRNMAQKSISYCNTMPSSSSFALLRDCPSAVTAVSQYEIRDSAGREKLPDNPTAPQKGGPESQSLVAPPPPTTTSAPGVPHVYEFTQFREAQLLACFALHPSSFEYGAYRDPGTRQQGMNSVLRDYKQMVHPGDSHGPLPLEGDIRRGLEILQRRGRQYLKLGSGTEFERSCMETLRGYLGQDDEEGDDDAGAGPSLPEGKK